MPNRLGISDHYRHLTPVKLDLPLPHLSLCHGMEKMVPLAHRPSPGLRRNFPEVP